MATRKNATVQRVWWKKYFFFCGAQQYRFSIGIARSGALKKSQPLGKNKECVCDCFGKNPSQWQAWKMAVWLPCFLILLKLMHGTFLSLAGERRV